MRYYIKEAAMNPMTRLSQQKNEVLAQLAALGPMRKGSLTEQYVHVTLKDGSSTRRGPYTLYSYKEDGKTFSRRLTRPEERTLYAEQIAAFRRFQELTAELARIGQAVADLEASGEQGCKKNSRR
jgi:hypothetical protein